MYFWEHDAKFKQLGPRVYLKTAVDESFELGWVNYL